MAEIIKNTLWLLGVICYLYIFSADHGAGLIAIVILVFSAFISWLAMVSLRPEESEGGLYFRVLGSDLWRSLVSARFVIGYSVFSALMPYIPFMIVTWFGDAQVIASYGAAMRYVGIVAMVGAALNAVLLPRIASMHADPKALREFVVSFVKRYLSALPLLGLLVLVVCWLIPFVDKGKYPLLPYIFASFSLAQIISIFSAPFVNALLVQRRAMTVFLIMVAGTLMSGISAFVLLGFFSDLAPVLGACVGYAVVAFAVFLRFRSSIDGRRYL